MKDPPPPQVLERGRNHLQMCKTEYLLLNFGILHFLDDIGGLSLTFLQMPWPYCVYPVYLSHLAARTGANHRQHYQKINQIHSNNMCQISTQSLLSILLKLTDFNQALFFFHCCKVNCKNFHKTICQSKAYNLKIEFFFSLRRLNLLQK